MKPHVDTAALINAAQNAFPENRTIKALCAALEASEKSLTSCPTNRCRSCGAKIELREESPGAK